MAVCVGIDLRCLPPDGEAGAGVAHAARELCLRLVKDHSFEWIAYAPRDTSWNACPQVALDSRSGSALRKGLKQKSCDLLFVPGGSIAPFIKIPALPWVHDLIIFEHPEWFPQSWVKRLVTKTLYLRGLGKAPVVFAVSQYTKKKVLERIHQHADRVIVTYEGGDTGLATITNYELRITKEKARKECLRRFEIRESFVLALGTVEPRKNLAMLIRAWKKTLTPAPLPRKQERGVDLVIAGQNGWKFEDVEREIEALDAESKQHFHRLENFSDHDKRQLLLAADAVCIPSLDEGFGLVALEAQQAGTKVISSNAGALPEVVGRDGILLDPRDEKAWAKALSNPSDDTEPYAINPEFTWDKAAEKVAAGLSKYGLPAIKGR